MDNSNRLSRMYEIVIPGPGVAVAFSCLTTRALKLHLAVARA